MQKNNYIYMNIITILSNKFIQIFLIIALLIFGYFCSTLDTKSSYFEALPMALTYQQFITLCFLPMIIFSDAMIITLFEKSSMVIIRFENKKNYLKELLKNIFFTNSFMFLVMIIIILTFFNFFSNGDLSIRYVENFKTINLLYTVYIVFKLYVMMLLTSFIFTLLFKLLNKTWTLIISIVMATSLYICQWLSIYTVIDKIYKMPLYFGIYFLDTIQYDNFLLNIFSFIIMIFLLSLFILILYKFVLKKMKAVGD